jgi:hypothetical protein
MSPHHVTIADVPELWSAPPPPVGLLIFWLGASHVLMSDELFLNEIWEQDKIYILVRISFGWIITYC